MVGLDGATSNLLEPWATHGHLSAFTRWMAGGVYGPLSSVPNTETGWATFATGLNPGKHSIFHEVDWGADRRTLRVMNGSDLHGKPFWHVASDAGRRVLVIHARFTYPVAPINGIIVAGADAPAESAHRLCYPAKFLAEFKDQVGPYRLTSRIQSLIKQNRLEEAIKDIFSVEARRTEALLFAMSQGDWDLAVITFDLPDAVQHFFWRKMVAGNGPQREAILKSYRFLERQIEHLLAQAGEETVLLIVSDHGFGPICATPEMLKGWLINQGFLRYLGTSHQPVTQRVTKAAYGWVRQRLNERQKAALRRWLPGLRNRVETDARFAGIDWTSTTAYMGPSAREVWVSTLGRETVGGVTPGAEYHQTRDTVISALLDWRTPEGLPRVRAIYRREEVYSGPFLQRAPDITIVWNPEAAPSPETLPGNLSHFDADHQGEGILLAYGPWMRSGHTIQNASLEDIAPTVLRLLEVTGLENMDGKVLAELVSTDAP